MKKLTIHLNLSKDTIYLPLEFSFNITDKSAFGDGEEVYFIDGETKLNGVRKVKLAHEGLEGHQHTFYAFIEN